ncbi:MAG: hypothetical protein KAU35_08085 [candidate division Zixibacteria bacterium]|nr:hypothetical protein [candidate division Zixibacteria bacterium]
MNTDILTSKPHTSTVLEAGYMIADSTTGFDETFPLGERGLLRITSRADATKTVFTILNAASEKEDANLQIEPSAEHMQEHRKLVDVVDLCITYCLGTTLLYQDDEVASNMTVINNFEQKLNERLVAEGKPTTHLVTVTTNACISYHGTTYVKDIRRAAVLAAECLRDVNKRDILNLYRDGNIRPYVAVERWYKIVEALRSTAEFKQISKAGQNYLKCYAQISRHHQSNQHHEDAKKYLKDRYSEELFDPKKGMETYKLYLMKLLQNRFRGGK